jgi:hypothetical protein
MILEYKAKTTESTDGITVANTINQNLRRDIAKGHGFFKNFGGGDGNYLSMYTIDGVYVIIKNGEPNGSASVSFTGSEQRALQKKSLLLDLVGGLELK